VGHISNFGVEPGVERILNPGENPGERVPGRLGAKPEQFRVE